MAEHDQQTTEDSNELHHHDIDDDDNHEKAAHKVVPAIDPSNEKQGAQRSDKSSQKKNKSSFDVEDLVETDPKGFINIPTPKDHSDFIRCHIKRTKAGLTKGFLTTFILSYESEDGHTHKPLLAARKHITLGRHLEYFIGLNFENPEGLAEENSLATLRGLNIRGTEYVLYDHQNTAHKQPHHQQMLAMIYNEEVFGTSQPRRLTVLLNDINKNPEALKVNETLVDLWNAGEAYNLLNMQNTQPAYNEETKQYYLDLATTRIKAPSHKNFQLVIADETAGEDRVVIQFGRIDETTFALDYKYPLTTLQAFSVALSAFHNRFPV